MRAPRTPLPEDVLVVRCPACGRRNRLEPDGGIASCGACGRPLPSLRQPFRGYRRRRAGLAGTAGRWLRQSGPRCARLATLLYVAALLAVWWLTTRVGEAWWLAIALVYAPRLLYGLPLIPLALLAARVDRRLLMAHAACLLFLLGPMMGWCAPARGAAPPAGAAPLRVLTYNVGGGPDSIAALLRTVAETAPDVVVTQEAENLASSFPGWTTRCAGELFMATRLPLVEMEARPMEANAPWRQMMRCRLIGPRGPFTLFAIHLFTPRRGLEELKGRHWHLIRWRNLPYARAPIEENAALRARQSASATAWITATPGPRVIAGDFNLPVDSPTFQAYWARYHDAFSEAGSGYGYTFCGPFPWMRIDHILLTPEWGISRIRTVPGSGRDHRPVIADLWMQ